VYAVVRSTAAFTYVMRGPRVVQRVGLGDHHEVAQLLEGGLEQPQPVERAALGGHVGEQHERRPDAAAPTAGTGTARAP
jgi:hypothetical protein